MRIALVDSGIGMLSTAAALHAARPDADLFLSMDPDHMPWGPRTPDEVITRAQAGARAARTAAGELAAVVVPCNTASVHGLDRLRAEFEPGVPVVGTVPAIKPAAASGGPLAVWSTAATTRSGYQRRLIQTFARDVDVTAVACTGLAEAVESADPQAIEDAVTHAVDLTPGNVRGIVLGCTHYDLVTEHIHAALATKAALSGPVGTPELFSAAEAVTTQTLRRIGDLAPTRRVGRITVLASGRPTHLPPAALTYPAGRALGAAQSGETTSERVRSSWMG